jgi:hypothetical protein
MPWQLIYTSAPRLLTAGQTGFGTVARHRDIPALVVSAVERASQFARLPGMDAERVVFSHRIVDAAGSRYHVVSRIASAGADYTGRTNHLAHHVIVTSAEAAELAAQGVSAADVALRFPWKHAWNETARWLEAHEMPSLSTLWPDRQEHLSAWMEATGDALHANHLITGTGARSGVIVIAAPKIQKVRLFVESLRAMPEQAWMFTFTTELDPGDAPGDFRWLGFLPNSPVLESMQAGRRFVLDLTRPESLPVAEPLPQKVSRPAPPTKMLTTLPGRPAAPPRVFTPAGSTFVEPAAAFPPPPIASRMAGSIVAPPPQERVRSQVEEPEGRDDAWGWRVVGFITLGACTVLAVVLFATGRLEFGRRDPVPVTPVSSTDTASPPPRPLPPATGTTTTAPLVNTAPPPPPTPPPPPVPTTPATVWRAAHVSQLNQVDLPHLRIEQIHKIVTSEGEVRGPLVETRNKLSLTIKDPTPVLKLNYAAHTAEWGNSPKLPIAPPLEWRVEQDYKEVMRIFIGDGTQSKPMSAAESAMQNNESTVTGAFAVVARKFNNQALWLRLPLEAEAQLRKCGYKGSPMVPLRDMKPDMAAIFAWVAGEQVRAKSIIDAPIIDPTQFTGSSSPPTLGSDPQGTKAARSKEVNTVDRMLPPSSSVAGNMQVQQQQMRTNMQRYLEKLTELRGSPILLGRFAPATCSFYAGPAGSSPEEAVWICDVIFAES